MTREEAINKLEHLINSPVGREEIDETCYEVMKYLAARGPRVMTLEEVKYSGMPVWLEWNYHFMKPALMHTDQAMTEDCRNAITFVLFGDEEWYTYADDDYGKEIRCWTSRPDQATMEAVPWN